MLIIYQNETVCHSRMLRSQLMLVIKLGLLIATKVGHTILKGSRAKVGDYFLKKLNFLHRYQYAIVGRYLGRQWEIFGLICFIFLFFSWSIKSVQTFKCLLQKFFIALNVFFRHRKLLCLLSPLFQCLTSLSLFISSSLLLWLWRTLWPITHL